MTYSVDDLTRISPRFATPDFIENGVTQNVAMPVYLRGALVVPDEASFTMLSASAGNDNPVIATTPATVTNGIATYNILDSVTSPLNYSDDWMEVWVLKIDGSYLEFRREAALCRTRLRPVISDDDLTRMHTELRDWASEDRTSYQSYIDAAWDEIQIKLMEMGNRPYLILSSYALRTSHIDLTLYYVFLDYAASASRDGKYMDVAEKYMTKFQDDWKRIHFRYDQNEDGLPGESKQNGSPVMFTNVPGKWNYGIGGTWGNGGGF